MIALAVLASSAASLTQAAGTPPGVAHPPFDVEQATRAYLTLLQGPARVTSDAYFEGGYWLTLWGALVGVAVTLALLASGVAARMSRWAERIARRRWLAPALFAVPFTLASTLLTLPWTIYTGFVRERHYGLMNQTFGIWLVDQGKALSVSLVLSALAFLAIFAVIRRFPRGWWALGAAVVAVFFGVGALLSPVFLAPLFNRYTEMPAGPLRDRIVAMARANDIPARHIYVSDASRQSKRISANVSGLGPTVRITLNDNLLRRTGPDEVAAVMGHEMGHYVLNHIPKMIAASALVFAGIFFVLSRAAPWLIARYPRWGVRDIADPAAVVVLSLLGSLLGLVLTPVQNGIIRHNEAEADRFGLDAAHEPDGFAKTAMRLSEYRKISPGPVEEALFFDHPSGETRVRRAMEWKRDHVPGATMATPDPHLLDR